MSRLVLRLEQAWRARDAARVRLIQLRRVHAYRPERLTPHELIRNYGRAS